MEKMIIRDNAVFAMKSKFDNMIGEREIKNWDMCMKYLGVNNLISNVFKENINDIENIKEKYKEILKSKNNNEYFKVVYKLNNKYCCCLTDHVYLYSIKDQIKINNKLLFDWIYPDSKIYLCDTWWFNDDEILDDFNNMPFINFIEKYKVY